LALHHAVLDRSCPWPRFLVRPQRHRRDRPGLVAVLAFLLENRRDVLGERDRPGGFGSKGAPGHGQGSSYRQRGFPNGPAPEELSNVHNRSFLTNPLPEARADAPDYSSI